MLLQTGAVPGSGFSHVSLIFEGLWQFKRFTHRLQCGLQTKGIVMYRICGGLLLIWVLLGISNPAMASKPFRVGVAVQNITPTRPTPMWGYGARHAALSTGVRDPLFAKAIVLEVGSTKLAIVGLDLGRGPREDMMQRMRKQLKQEASIDYLLISGSHTHHGPVLELIDEPGKGQGVFQDTVEYSREFEAKLTQTILQAAAKVQDAKLGWGSMEVDMNRNRHSKLEPKPRDTELGVIRFEGLDGKAIALIVNFAAHPTMLEAQDLRFSADWPGEMAKRVEEQTMAPCVFMQGAAGDMSVKTPEGVQGVEAFGAAMAELVMQVQSKITTTVPEKPSIVGRDRDFEFETRVPFNNPLTKELFSQAFFPELASASMTEDISKNRIHPHLTTILLHGELALVGASGEFFSQHATLLKQRSRAKGTFFFGYCNGHHMYFPTIQGAAEGGYGADPTVSWVSLGAGEEMMNQALIAIYSMMGSFSIKFPP